MNGRVVSVNVGVIRTGDWTGAFGRTGIDKRPAPGRVVATRLGLVGDPVIDTRFHGGVDQALYAYAREDADWWARELGREVPPGNLGENLTTAGVDVTNALIGERWAVGPLVVEVSLPRKPCRVLAGFWDMPDIIPRFIDHGAPGAYLRVIVEGDVGAGDPVEVIHRPEHGVTVGFTLRALTNEPELLSRLAGVPELPDKVRQKVQRRLAQPSPIPSIMS